MMRYALLLAALAVPALPAHAIEYATVGGDITNQAKWNAALNQLGELETKLAAATATAARIKTCNANAATYTPGHPDADANGCVSTFTTMETKVVGKTLCENTDNVHKVTVTCESGWQLLSCAGGPGDLADSHEGYFIKPNGANGCELTVGKPRCETTKPNNTATVFAYCGKPGLSTSQ